jgi:ABC-2 type transport system permease protein
MVWIALTLLAFSVALVGFVSATGRYSMARWRTPRGSGQTLDVALKRVESARAVVPSQATGANLFAGVARSVIAQSEFLIFSKATVFGLFVSFLLPLWSLSFSTEALGGDREARSLVWLLTRPLPRPAIYLAKFVALLPWSVGFNMIGFALLCAAAGRPGWTALRLYWPAVLAASLAFSALFLLIGATFRRPAVVAIVYSFFLEIILGNMPGYLKRVSLSFYTRCMMFEAAQQFGVEPEKPSVYLPVDGLTACLTLLGVTAGLVVLGMVLFNRTEYVAAD